MREDLYTLIILIILLINIAEPTAYVIYVYYSNDIDMFGLSKAELC